MRTAAKPSEKSPAASKLGAIATPPAVPGLTEPAGRVSAAWPAGNIAANRNSKPKHPATRVLERCMRAECIML
jgi:hypothetical protein